MSQSTVYLIPSPLFPSEVHSIPESVQKIAVGLRHYYAEQIRTTRRVLKLYEASVPIDDIEFVEMNHRQDLDTAPFLRWLKEGKDIGIMSEAGLPAMADPGAQLIALAHRAEAKVRPLTGPGSIYLALTASGFNGQHFEFLGYLPIEAAARVKAIQQIEARSRSGRTQIFIETPYRNNQMLEILCKNLSPNTFLCVAANLTSPEENVRTARVADWSRSRPDLHKQPCIFLIG